jgi:hypothetical protein
MSATSHPQAIPRTAALDSNLKEQLKWLSQNLTGASYSGFNYAPKASEDFVVPTVFNFDNHSRRASNNSTLASLSEVGDFELQSFRAKNSFFGNSSTVPKELPSSSSGWSSSGRSNVPSIEWDGQDTSDGHENNVPNSYKRPSVGSFLGQNGTSKNYENAGYTNSVNSSAGRAYDHVNNNNSKSSSSSSSKYAGQGGSNQNNNNNDWHQNNYNSERRENDYNNSHSKNDYSTSNIAAKTDYSMDISDSQLAGLDIDGQLFQTYIRAYVPTYFT